MKIFIGNITIFLIFFLSSCQQEVQNPSTMVDDGGEKSFSNSGSISSDTIELNEKEKNQAIVQGKIETIRKRLALKGLIIDGDGYYRDGQHVLALRKYLDFYKENENDDLIKAKIADTYFAMKRFDSAVEYYSQIGVLNDNTLDNYILSLLYETNISNATERANFLEKVEEISSNEEIVFYYLNTFSCLDDFHGCKLQFQEYFGEETPNSVQNIEDISEGGVENIISYSKLVSIHDAIINYRNFGIDDVDLKNAYIVGSYFEQEMYPIAITLGTQILETKPDYKPVLKIVAQSYFEIGDYDTARDKLTQYYEIDDEDPAIAYILGVINNKLREYVLSNIYFSKALSLGYDESLLAYRQIIHNYYTIDDEERIRLTFQDMISFEPDYEDIDLSLAIYYHILGEDLRTARKYAKLGQERFPSNADFYGYEGWILREQGNISASLEVLNTGISIDSKNPFVITNAGYTEKEAENYSKALIYFKNIAKNFKNTEFADIANTEIASIELRN